MQLLRDFQLRGERRRSSCQTPPKVPLVAPPYSWTGFYVGANVGAVWAHSDVARTDLLYSPFFLRTTVTGTAA